MNRARQKTVLAMLGIVAVAVGTSVVAAQAATMEPAPIVGDGGTYYAPGEHVELPADQGPTPEELEVFNRLSKESFRQLVRENPDLELHDLNE